MQTMFWKNWTFVFEFTYLNFISFKYFFKTIASKEHFRRWMLRDKRSSFTNATKRRYVQYEKDTFAHSMTEKTNERFVCLQSYAFVYVPSTSFSAFSSFFFSSFDAIVLRSIIQSKCRMWGFSFYTCIVIYYFIYTLPDFWKGREIKLTSDTTNKIAHLFHLYGSWSSCTYIIW